AALPPARPVPELLYRDEDKPAWARPSGAMPVLAGVASPFALPRGPMDATWVPPASRDGSEKQTPVRIQLEQGAPTDGAAETVDAELVDLDTPGVPTTPDEDDHIPDAERLADPDDHPPLHDRRGPPSSEPPSPDAPGTALDPLGAAPAAPLDPPDADPDPL